MEKKRILCFGDSNTYGYDPRSYFGSQYPEDVRWTGRIRSSDLVVINCGLNGRTIPTEGEFPVTDRLIRSKMPLDVLAVMLGSNDLMELRSAEMIANRMKGFLVHLQETPETGQILLIAPPPVREGVWVQSPALIEESKRIGMLYRSLAGELSVEFADSEEWNVELSFDGVHLSPTGHAVFAEEMRKTLDRMPSGNRRHFYRLLPETEVC